MLSHIKLKNFQSHKDTQVDLHPGVNTLIGTSNHGKSSVIRALLLTLTNQPSGDAFISHWTRNKKDKITEDMVVELGLVDGSKVRRIKGTDNRYETEDDLGYVEPYHAFGKSNVPEQITELLNIGETNLQRQDQNFYLFAESSSEVVRRINSYTNLDLIDEALVNADKDMRENRSQEKKVQSRIEETVEKLQDFETLDAIEKLYNESVEVQTKVNELKAKRISLTSIIEQIEFVEEALKQYSTIERLQRIMTKAEGFQKKIETAQSKYSRIKELIESVTEIQKEIPNIDDDIYDRFEEVQEVMGSIRSVRSDIDVIRKILQSYETVDAELQDINKMPNIQKALETLEEIKFAEEDYDTIQKIVELAEQKKRILEYKIEDYNALHEEFHELMGDRCILCGHATQGDKK